MSWYIDIALVLMGLVGFSLGLLGGGGSILAVPVMVYVARIAPAQAITMSLLVVGATSAIGGVAHNRVRAVDWRVATVFGGAGVATAFVGGLLTRLVAARTLLASFATLMIVVGGWMLTQGHRRAGESDVRRAPRPVSALLAGAAVGGVTGFLGVGGGFLIVPALIAFTGLDMRRAIGTSLLVIATNSGAALLGHAGGGRLDWTLASAFTALATGGSLLGARLGHQIPADKLRATFAILVVGIGFAMALHSGFSR